MPCLQYQDYPAKAEVNAFIEDAYTYNSENALSVCKRAFYVS